MKSMNANGLNIRWTREVEGKLSTEKVNVEECEMQVGDEQVRERRKMSVPYEREHIYPLRPSSTLRKSERC